MKIVLFANHEAIMPVIAHFYGQKWLEIVLCSQKSATENIQTEILFRELNIPLYTFTATDLTPTVRNLIDEFQLNLAFIYAFLHKLPYQLFFIPAMGYLNIHFGLLPTHGGPDPIFWQIKNSEQMGRITIYHVDKNFNSGEILMQRQIQFISGKSRGIFNSRYFSVVLNMLVGVRINLQSLQESFRVDCHSRFQKKLEACLLKDAPQAVDTTGLFEECTRLKPARRHLISCSREPKDVIEKCDEMVDYLPSLSFTFPITMSKYNSIHPSLLQTYTAFPGKVKLDILNVLSVDIFTTSFKYVAGEAAFLMDNPCNLQKPYNISRLEMNIGKNKIMKTAFSENLPTALNAAFNYSAENATKLWQTPYLCI